MTDRRISQSVLRYDIYTVAYVAYAPSHSAQVEASSVPGGSCVLTLGQQTVALFWEGAEPLGRWVSVGAL